MCISAVKIIYVNSKSYMFADELLFNSVREQPRGGSPYNGLYRKAPPTRGNFFRLEVYKRVGIS